MAEPFARIDADPYPWPFDGRWSAADTALLLLGLQMGAVARLAAEAETAVAVRLAAAARRAGVAVIATRRGARGEPSPVAARRARLGDQVADYSAPEWRLVEGLAQRPELQVIDHAGDNAFFATGLEASLRARNIDRLLFAGLPTEGLVHASMRAANDMGFECLLVSDATKGTTPERRDAQLRMTAFGNGLFGAHAPTALVLSALGDR